MIGSDIVMPLDECLSYPSDIKTVERSIYHRKMGKEMFDHFQITNDR